MLDKITIFQVEKRENSVLFEQNLLLWFDNFKSFYNLIHHTSAKFYITK